MAQIGATRLDMIRFRTLIQQGTMTVSASDRLVVDGDFYRWGGSDWVREYDGQGEVPGLVPVYGQIDPASGGISSLVSPDGISLDVLEVYPETYGDVSSDAAAAVAAAAVVAAAAGAALKFIPGKTYTFRNVPIPAGVRVIDARGATLQYGGSYGTVAPLESVKVMMYADGNPSAPSPGIRVLGGFWIGAQIAGNYNNVTAGSEHDCLQFANVASVSIVGATFQKFQQDAVTFANAPGTVQWCNFSDICDGAVELRTGSNYVIENCTFTRVRHMVVCKPNINNVTVRKNSGTTFRQGIVGHGNDWTIEDNTIGVYDTPDSILGNSQPAIEWSDYGALFAPLDTYRTYIRRNTILDRTNANAIQIKAPASPYTPYDIYIEDNPAVSSRRGILLERGVGVSVRRNTINAGAGGGVTSNAAQVSGLAVEGNTITAVGTSGSGIIDLVTPGAAVNSNTLTSSTAGVIGIRLTSAATAVGVKQNTVSVTSGVGILANGAGSTLELNDVTTTAAAAIEIGGAGSVIKNSPQIKPAGGEGVLIKALNVTVMDSTITGGTQGIRVGAAGSGAAASGASLLRLRVGSAQFWGVNITSGAVGTVVRLCDLRGNTSGALTDAGTGTVDQDNTKV